MMQSRDSGAACMDTNLHEIGLQQVFTGADVLSVDKRQATRGLHFVHDCE